MVGELLMEGVSLFIALADNGGRRLIVDRRQFSYTDHIPDRRFSNERRINKDRRNKVEQRSGKDRRNGKPVEIRFSDTRTNKDRRCGSERRAASLAAFD